MRRPELSDDRARLLADAYRARRRDKAYRELVLACLAALAMLPGPAAAEED